MAAHAEGLQVLARLFEPSRAMRLRRLEALERAVDVIEVALLCRHGLATRRALPAEPFIHERASLVINPA